MATDQEQFWVIFDTCSRPEYYQDVHDLLALPPGGILRYNYREKYLSDPAREQSDSIAAEGRSGHGPITPSDVLLVYGEYEGMRHGADLRTFPGETPRRWIGTRLAKLIHVESVADDYFYDLRLGNYPMRNDGALRQIIADLDTRGDTPFRRWVAISRDRQNLELLAVDANEDEKWSQIVERFQQLDTQFVGDSFWRIRSITDQNGRLLPIEQETGRRGARKEQERPRAYLSLHEGDQIVLHFMNREPVPRPAAAPPSLLPGNLEGPPMARRTLVIDDSGAPVKLPSDEKVHALRQYFLWDIRGITERSASIREKRGAIRMKTEPATEPYPVGAKLDLEFRVRKRLSEIVWMLILLAGASVAGLASKELWKQDLGFAIFLAVVATLAAVMIPIILTGAFKGPSSKE